jgi:RimJ/RimL family protein N-acetyltransferase
MTPLRLHADPVAHSGGRYVAHVDGEITIVQADGGTLRVGPEGARAAGPWRMRERAGTWVLEHQGPCSGEPDGAETLAALEAAFQLYPERTEFALSVSQLPDGFRDGIAALRPGSMPTVARDILWQQPRLWLPRAHVPYALKYAMTQGTRHPLRPPKPRGTVYQRFIPWLGMTLSLRTVDRERDLVAFNRWMNDPVVARFWEEQGDLAKHRTYLERTDADPHVIGLVGCFDGEPFGYLEAYWAKEDRVAPFYDAEDYDRGWHALVGEARFRGKPFLTAWLPSISHYLFLDDCRTQRIVVEPRSDNQKMRTSLPRCGYALLKEFDFPHKRAVLGMLSRERFFAEALWIPQPDASAADGSTQ